MSTAEPGQQVRVFLLDDHEVVRRGLADLLERHDDLVVAGEKLGMQRRTQMAVFGASVGGGEGA